MTLPTTTTTTTVIVTLRSLMGSQRVPLRVEVFPQWAVIPVYC